MPSSTAYLILAACLVASLLPGTTAVKASCQITCTDDVSDQNTLCGASVTSWGQGCEQDGASFTRVSNVTVKCYGDLDCSGESSINACNNVASNLGFLCGGCTGKLIDCKDEKCFPANATVQLQDGSIKTMATLQVGDSVHVGNDQFSTVFMFSHRLSAEQSKSVFVSLTTDDGTTIQLTANHYLYVNGKLAAAETVKIGDKLSSANGDQLEVVSVGSVAAEGLYNPQTMHGDIVVNGIKTSCYTTAVHPTLAHAALWPIRALYSAGIDIVGDKFDEGSEFLAGILPKGPARN